MFVWNPRSYLPLKLVPIARSMLDLAGTLLEMLMMDAMAAIESVRMLTFVVYLWAARALAAPALSRSATEALVPRYTCYIHQYSG